MLRALAPDVFCVLERLNLCSKSLSSLSLSKGGSVKRLLRHIPHLEVWAGFSKVHAEQAHFASFTDDEAEYAERLEPTLLSLFNLRFDTYKTRN